MVERIDSLRTITGRVWASINSTVRERTWPLINSLVRGRTGAGVASQATAALRIARYKLILMDNDGQVVWTGDWDAGGTFEFSRRQSLLIFCEFTNRSHREAEIAEYEIELMAEDGDVVGRFGNSFGESIVVLPGQSKVLTGKWQL